MSKKKLLITGSAGFIFANFIRHLIYNKNKYDIVSIDKISSPYSLHNVYANKGHTFYVGDISDAHFIDIIFQLEKPDIVINGAAESRVDDSIYNAQPFVQSNVMGTQVLIDACLKHGVDRFFQISTDEVLGQLDNEHDEAWNEESETQPRNPYAATKTCAELLVQAASITHGLKYNITRACNNFGPRQSVKNLIPKIIKSILNNEKMPIFGHGRELREWMYVIDKCEAIKTIIEKAPPNEIYNISTNWELSNLELFNKICNIMGKGHDLLTFIEDPRGGGHDFRYSIDSTKLRDLGWKPQFKFSDSLQKTIQWYVNNQWFLKE